MTKPTRAVTLSPLTANTIPLTVAPGSATTFGRIECGMHPCVSRRHGRLELSDDRVSRLYLVRLGQAPLLVVTQSASGPPHVREVAKNERLELPASSCEIHLVMQELKALCKWRVPCLSEPPLIPCGGAPIPTSAPTPTTLSTPAGALEASEPLRADEGRSAARGDAASHQHPPVPAPPLAGAPSPPPVPQQQQSNFRCQVGPPTTTPPTGPTLIPPGELATKPTPSRKRAEHPAPVARPAPVAEPAPNNDGARDDVGVGFVVGGGGGVHGWGRKRVNLPAPSLKRDRSPVAAAQPGRARPSNEVRQQAAPLGLEPVSAIPPGPGCASIPESIDSSRSLQQQAPPLGPGNVSARQSVASGHSLNAHTSSATGQAVSAVLCRWHCDERPNGVHGAAVNGGGFHGAGVNGGGGKGAGVNGVVKTEAARQAPTPTVTPSPSAMQGGAAGGLATIPVGSARQGLIPVGSSVLAIPEGSAPQGEVALGGSVLASVHGAQGFLAGVRTTMLAAFGSEEEALAGGGREEVATWHALGR